MVNVFQFHGQKALFRNNITFRTSTTFLAYYLALSTTRICCLTTNTIHPSTSFIVRSSKVGTTLSNKIHSSQSVPSFGQSRFIHSNHIRSPDPVLLFSSTSMSTSSTPTKKHTQKTVLVPIADGSEEIETTCIQDTLVRFGASVTIASVKTNGELVCTMSRGIKFMADCHISDVQNESYDLIVLPGGMPGAEHLRDCTILTTMLQKQKEVDSDQPIDHVPTKWYGAICAAPAVALHSNGLIDDDMIITCYPAPGFRDTIHKNFDSSRTDEAVIVSKNCVTSQGPGTAIEFGLKLGELLYGIKKRNEVAKAMLMK